MEGATHRLKSLYEIEKEAILARMEALNGNKTKVAASLGISLKTLYNRLQKYRVSDKEIK